MAINRRRFLLFTGAAAGLFGGNGVHALPRAARASEEIYLSAAAWPHGRRQADKAVYQACLFDGSGAIQAVIDLPARGHGAAFRPGSRDTAIFARRPGNFAIVFDRATGEIRHEISAPDGRHFYGHGVFSRDGRLLYTTENDYDRVRGMIGVWEAERNYRRAGAFEAHGVGPHDIALSPDGASLIIANGGIATHPETGRRKLNIPDMKPSLAVIDVRDGELRASAGLPRDLHKLSIRHLAVAKTGLVAAAMQYQGPEGDLPPLVLRWRGGTPDLLDAPAPVWRTMKNYCGSIVSDKSAAVMAVSAPRGGIVTFWDMAQGRYLRSVAMPDGCGLAPGPEPFEFLLSSGTGARAVVNAATGVRRALARMALRWDNHIAWHPGS